MWCGLWVWAGFSFSFPTELCYGLLLAPSSLLLLLLILQVAELGLQDAVAFLPSFTDAQRSALLAAATVVVYTPQNEHFGIVPIEAMAAGKPVVACSSGGPKESIADGETGLLCDPTPAAFAAALGRLLEGGGKEATRMGKAARARVEAMFSRPAFGSTLDKYVRVLAGSQQPPARKP